MSISEIFRTDLTRAILAGLVGFGIIGALLFIQANYFGYSNEILGFFKIGG